MNLGKQLIIMLVLSLIHLCPLQEVSGDDSNGISNDSNTTSINVEDDGGLEKMANELKREREKLLEIKAKFSEKSEEEISEIAHEGPQAQISNEDVEEDIELVISNDSQEALPLIDEENESEDYDFAENKTDDIEKEEIIINEEYIEKIINPFEIAENLYKLKEYKTALDIYGLLNKEGMKGNKGVWISFQIANCHRRLKQFNEALEVYRNLETTQKGTYWAKQANWYIKEIEWQKEVNDKLEMIGEE